MIEQPTDLFSQYCDVSRRYWSRRVNGFCQRFLLEGEREAENLVWSVHRFRVDDWSDDKRWLQCQRQVHVHSTLLSCTGQWARMRRQLYALLQAVYRTWVHLPSTRGIFLANKWLCEGNYEVKELVDGVFTLLFIKEIWGTCLHHNLNWYSATNVT